MLTREYVLQLVDSMGYLHEYEDCSEVAERIIMDLGAGDPMTIMCINNAGIKVGMSVPQTRGMFDYHVVVSLGNFVIDLITVGRVWDAAVYSGWLTSMNNTQENMLVYCMGDVSDHIIGRARFTEAALEMLGMQRV